VTDLILDETFGDRLASSGYVRGVSLPGNAMYTADVSLERDPQQNRSVMVTLTEDAFILTSFTFPTAEVSGEAVDGARDAGDGYSRTQLHDHWVIGERIDGGILPDFSGWAPVLADADMVQRILSFVITRTVEMANYADKVVERVIASRREGAQPEVDRESVFGALQVVLNDPDSIVNGSVPPERFLELTRAAFEAVREPESFEQVYAFVRGQSMQALANGSMDSPWFVISDGMGALQEEWGWSN